MVDCKHSNKPSGYIQWTNVTRWVAINLSKNTKHHRIGHIAWNYHREFKNMHKIIIGSIWWGSWLSHYATSQKVEGSVPNGVTEIFHWLNPFGHTTALGSKHPLTEISTSNISWGGKGCRADNLTTFMCQLSRNLGASTSWNPQGLSRPVMGLLYLLIKW